MLRQIARQTIKAVASESEKILTRRFFADPFGTEPQGTVKDYEAIHQDARQLQFPAVADFEAEMGYAIDRAWFESLAFQTQVTRKKSRVQYPHGRLMYSALRGYLARTKATHATIYETGTARGFSALCLARALQDHGIPGHILTFDLLPHGTPIYWNCVADCDGVKKTRAQLLAPFEPLPSQYVTFICGDSMLQLKRIQSSRIHFASLDGAHDFENVAFEAKTIAESQQAGDVIYFDDYNPGEFQGLVDAVDQFVARAGYDLRLIPYGDNRFGGLATRK